MSLTHALVLSAKHFFYQRKSPFEYVHSVRIELAKLILVGTRMTYQATVDAVSMDGKKKFTKKVNYDMSSISVPSTDDPVHAGNAGIIPAGIACSLLF